MSVLRLNRGNERRGDESSKFCLGHIMGSDDCRFTNSQECSLVLQCFASVLIRGVQIGFSPTARLISCNREMTGSELAKEVKPY